jgi:hypothetical protein
MKIVVNKCYGGFGLSDKACKRLIELGIRHFESFEKLTEDSENPYIIDSHDSLCGDYYTNFNKEKYRTHPLLIQVIEELGEKEASSKLANLRILDIPDNIQYEIDDYDGIETIHEIHRSW